MPSPTSPETALDLVHRGWDHLRMDRPLAAWASWQKALRIEPEDQAATEALAILESASDLPSAARTAYRFRSPEESRRVAWTECFEGRDMSDLAVASEAFRELADGDPEDSAASFNRALCLAWLGENVQALANLELSVWADAARSPDRAIASWRLAEILRQGAGADAWADDRSVSLSVDWPESDGDAPEFLASVAPDLRPVPVPVDPATGSPPVAARVYEWLDRRMPEADRVRSAADLPRVLVTVILTPGRVRLSSPDRPSLESAESAFLDAIGGGFVNGVRTSTRVSIRLMDASVWTFRLPELDDPESAVELRRAAVERFFEHDWITRPRFGLSPAQSVGIPETPIEASRRARDGDAIALAKLSAVIDIREQLASRPRVMPLYAGYPFDRLRRRLGLAPNNPAAFDPGDVTCMSAEELDRLDPTTLDDSTLAEAVESARPICDTATSARLRSEAEGRTR